LVPLRAAARRGGRGGGRRGQLSVRDPVVRGEGGTVGRGRRGGRCARREHGPVTPRVARLPETNRDAGSWLCRSGRGVRGGGGGGDRGGGRGGAARGRAANLGGVLPPPECRVPALLGPPQPLVAQVLLAVEQGVGVRDRERERLEQELVGTRVIGQRL